MVDPVETTSAKAHIHEAALEAWRADPQLQALFGGTVAAFDSTPHEAAYPHLVLGEVQGIPERADGYDGEDVVFTFHTWDQPEPPSLGKRRCIAISDRATAVLLDLEITAPFVRLVEAQPEGDVHMNDSSDGGLTKHSVSNVRWLTEPL